MFSFASFLKYAKRLTRLQALWHHCFCHPRKFSHSYCWRSPLERWHQGQCLCPDQTKATHLTIFIIHNKAMFCYAEYDYMYSFLYKDEVNKSIYMSEVKDGRLKPWNTTMCFLLLLLFWLIQLVPQIPFLSPTHDSGKEIEDLSRSRVV